VGLFFREDLGRDASHRLVRFGIPEGSRELRVLPFSSSDRISRRLCHGTTPPTGGPARPRRLMDGFPRFAVDCSFAALPAARIRLLGLGQAGTPVTSVGPVGALLFLLNWKTGSLHPSVQGK